MTVVADGGSALVFDMGRVVRRITELVKSKGLYLAVGSLLGYGAPNLLRAWLTPKLLSLVFLGNSFPAKVGRFAVGEVGTLLVAACGALVSAWISLIMVREFTGDGRSILGKSARDVAMVAWPIALTRLIYSVGIFAGTVLFIVPGIILMTAWYVTTPVLAYEHRSIRATFTRSLELTRGNRGHIFAILLALSIAEIVINLTVMKVASPGLSFTAMALAPISQLVISPLLGPIEYIVSAAAMASVYIELVELKDGGFRSAVLDAFD